MADAAHVFDYERFIGGRQAQWDWRRQRLFTTFHVTAGPTFGKISLPAPINPS